MRAPVPCAPDVTITKEIMGVLKRERVDFTGDGRLDYIILLPDDRTVQQPELLGREQWISFPRKVVFEQLRWSSDYAFRWFVNLDDDPAPEMISAYGFEDGIDCTIEKLDVAAQVLTEVFYFEPVLIGGDGSKFHGYPWDWKDIQVRRTDCAVQILGAIREWPEAETLGNDNEGQSEEQHRLPRVVFEGTSSQPDIAKLEQFETAELRPIVKIGDTLPSTPNGAETKSVPVFYFNTSSKNSRARGSPL